MTISNTIQENIQKLLKVTKLCNEELEKLQIKHSHVDPGTNRYQEVDDLQWQTHNRERRGEGNMDRLHQRAF